MIKPIDDSYKLFIDGQWMEGKERKTFQTYSPADGSFLATCVEAGKEDVDMAVDAAWNAYKTWKDVSPQERTAILLKIADLIDENAEKLAMIETMDNGKPIRNSLGGDIPLCADHFRYFAGVIRSQEDKAVMLDNQTMSVTLREPLGVIGEIIPWNFPLVVSAWKIAPAIAAGNCVVVKPSSMTSLSMLELAKLMNQVLPHGVVNVVTGGGDTVGKYMLGHKGFSKLAFTGSLDVGYDLAKAAAERLIPATYELGGKSANIFFPDCLWEKAIEGVQIGILFNQGQFCGAGSRVFIHEDIYERFLAEAIAAFERVKVGMPWEKDTQMGCQISEKQMKGVLDYIELGKKAGAKVACGGYRMTDNGLEKGYFVKPTILVDVDNKMRIAQEEIFGPVACFIKFKDEKEVVEMANDSKYGLCGAVWTRDINRALRMARSIEAGRVWINNYGNVSAHAPFGGYKKSGIGRDAHAATIDSYTQKKNIFISMSEKAIGMY